MGQAEPRIDRAAAQRMHAGAHALDRGLGAAQELGLDREAILDLARLRLQAQVEHQGDADQHQRDQRLDQREAAVLDVGVVTLRDRSRGSRQPRDAAGRTFDALERRAVPAGRGPPPPA